MCRQNTEQSGAIAQDHFQKIIKTTESLEEKCKEMRDAIKASREYCMSFSTFQQLDVIRNTSVKLFLWHPH